MTAPTLTLLVAAGSDLDGARSTVDAARLVRARHDSWDLVVVADAPVECDLPWVHVTVAPGSRPEQLARALAAARGTWVAVLGPGDRLEPGALEAVHRRLADSPATDVLYTDEQWPGEGASGIFTKPAWSPEYERSTGYLGRLCALRRTLLVAAGGFTADSAGAEEWDAHLRVVERTDAIVHLAVVGLSRQSAPTVDDTSWEAGLEAVRRHFDRVGQDVHVDRGAYPGSALVRRAVPERPLVSVVVPTGGGRRVVRGTEVLLAELCARSLVERTAYDRWELVLVPSQGTPDDVVEAVRAVVGDRLVVAPVEGDFNFSTSVNTGVAAARGDLVLLLNDDVDADGADWLDRMVSVLQDPAVGVVGARLVHEDERLQHVGVVYSDVWVPWHVLQGNPDGFTHFGLGLVDADFVATTGACLLMSRELYREVGGLPEDLPLNYNDVDLCHKVVLTGRRVVVTPAARLYHYESSTREATIRDDEVARLQGPWEWLAWRDPWENTRSTR
ncbi:glycosyltransferase family 2 protein [Cellulomonas fimi]|uniref:Glycosyl transferase family 2 n=1 Tax=Cellulomonas fimi (strain ATCC 484 / DSM 20113 / JCM 1341 / CCUG 24087 / LMG 16345 / NBRC 15513 / NCIMB 8980 / NCTC 7547 / NRS-133) TaxID=590998 RepID=F4H530_CELFA|nr:glycosyltransferase [Cellulomonas fimi]AEE46636.1 glycosyl transferase family 2 [Cellulomonas fimi ATCC 484]NNH08332.1 glycosyltransferase [Cellulomonas fimi]VEH33732.1 Predicted pyridoxal phosphate-dependent enzyme apparently involved in regulation of cell wall biogenesis [Cellulomonas fimi]